MSKKSINDGSLDKNEKIVNENRYIGNLNHVDRSGIENKSNQEIMDQLLNELENLFKNAREK